MICPERTYRVYTFYCPEDGTLCRSRIMAYTRWCPSHWPGGKVYDVMAASGTAAKRKAVTLRLQHELAKVGDA